MLNPPLRKGLAADALRATWLSQAARFRDRIVTRLTEQQGMGSAFGFGSAARGHGLIDALLHQIVSEIGDVSHGQHLASSG
jgi:hypothetical protein